MASHPATAATGMREIDPALRIASVALAVSDLQRSVEFYSRALGLTLISGDGEDAQLATAADRPPALLLHRLDDPAAASPHATGLFHVAWLHRSRADLAATIERLLAARWPIDGASDHGVSEALYLSDPDGLGIEIYADRPRERWPRASDGREIAMFTRALDVDDLLAQAPAKASAAMPADAGVGHVHLKVADVRRAATFYRDQLGLREQAHMPSAAFLAAGDYHHHVGLNSWQSAGASAPPDSAPGLREVTFALSSPAWLARLGDSLQGAVGDSAVERARDRLRVHDPDGVALAFVAGADQAPR